MSSKFVHFSFLHILEEAINKTKILEQINGWPQITASLEYLPIEQEYSTKPDYSSKSDDTKNIEKLQKECNFLKRTLEETASALRTTESFQPLEDIINNYQCHRNDIDNFLQNAKTNEQNYKELLNGIEQQKVEYYEKIQNCTEEIGRIKDEISDFQKQSNIKLKYVENWQNSKHEIQEFTQAKKEEETEHLIKSTTRKMDQEEKIHTELSTFLYEVIDDLQKSIKSWKNNYKTTLQKINSDIDEINEERRILLQKKTSMLDLLQKRNEEMAAYIAHKEKLAKEAAELNKRITACITIQAWWRGTMVRKGFGPYKKKKDKKAKKKDSGNTKKK